MTVFKFGFLIHTMELHEENLIFENDNRIIKGHAVTHAQNDKDQFFITGLIIIGRSS